MPSFLWGLFCACSWTWCIGMFLPRLMIERWGWWGFIAFAAPNVIGCTAFGYVVRNRARSDDMIARQSTAMIWFSAVTLAYHMFFVVWLFDSLIAIPQIGFLAPVVIAAIIFALAGVFSFLNDRDWLGLSVLVYAISLLGFWKLGAAAVQSVEWDGELKFAGLGAIVPFLFFGFLICPYLDLTFHRAIRNSPSRHSFAVFGVTFLVMIVLSVAIWFWPEYLRSKWLPAIVIGHLLGQTVFTMGAHMREIRVSPLRLGKTERGVAIVAPLLAAPLVYAAQLVRVSESPGEDVYIALLVLYGTLFPAWFVWNAIKRPGH